MYSNDPSRSSESLHELPDSCGFLSADSTNPRQLSFVGSHDTFDRPKFQQQTGRQGRTHAGKALQHVELARSQTLWLAVVPFQTIFGAAELIREEAQKSQRVFRVAGPEHR